MESTLLESNSDPGPSPSQGDLVKAYISNWDLCDKLNIPFLP